MRKNGKTNAVGRGGALLRPAGYTELSKIFGESVCTYPLGHRGRCRSQPFATKERYGCGSAACRYTSARQFAPFFRKSPANSRLPKGPTESSAPTTTLALSCRGGRLCPPADCTVFYENLRRIRGCPRGRCGHRPLHDSGKFVLPRKFRIQGGEDGAVGDMTSPQICTTPPPDKTAPFRSNGAVRIHMARAVILRK